MGKFEKYSGKVTLTVDGEEYIITPTNRQVAKFLAMDKDKAKTEEGFVNMTDALTSMFVDAYPAEPKEEIAGFVLKKMDVIMTELVLKMGWATQKDLDKVMSEEKGKESQAAKKV